MKAVGTMSGGCGNSSHRVNLALCLILAHVCALSTNFARERTSRSLVGAPPSRRAAVSLASRVSSFRNSTKAFEFLLENQEHCNEKAWENLVRLCRRNADANLACSIFTSHCQTPTTQQMAIQTCCNAEQFDSALNILETKPTIAALNAVASGVPNAKRLLLAKSTYEGMATTLTYNIILKKTRNSTDAFRLLERMEHPDHLSFLYTLQACYHSRDVKLAMETVYKNPSPSQQDFDLLTKACSRVNDWSRLAEVDALRKSILGSYGGVSRRLVFDSDMDLQRIKPRDRRAYWVLGSYSFGETTWSIAIQPNRNACVNGMKLLAIDPKNKQKIAHVLLEPTNGGSSLLGVHIEKNHRNQGFSKHLLSIWIELCDLAGIQPVTGVMRKPLLSLVLQHSFGFRPKDTKGSDVFIYPHLGTRRLLLYCPGKNLEGVFPPHTRKRERIQICSSPPVESGRQIRVNGKLVRPAAAFNSFLPGHLQHSLDKNQSRMILTGA